MPIVDYKRLARLAEAEFFSIRHISPQNKKLVEKFMEIYDVSPARKAIFFKHIKLVLEKTNDISVSMHDPDKINKIFRELRDKLGVGYYSTIVNVSQRFVKWLNDDLKPKGFKDVKSVPKSKQKRQLAPKDMFSWEDGLKMISATNNIMMKAIVATQLDGGMRPSEFIDLNFGDVNIKGEFIILDVNQGKTGARPVILWRAVPFLLKWIQSHPSKRKNDPLWVLERDNDNTVQRYEYRAVFERIRRLAAKAEIDKPIDFYNFRHSACTISKKDNVPEEIAAAKFVHTIEYYTNTYGRLSTDDVIDRFSRHYGLTHEKAAIKKNIKCEKCEFVNLPESDTCEKFSSPLSIKRALQIEKEKQTLSNEVEKLKEERESDKADMRNFLRQEIKKQIKVSLNLKS